MESVLGDSFYLFSKQLPISYLLRICLLLPVLFFLIKFYLKRKSFLDKLDRIPSSRVRSYNILGHMSHLINKYIFEYPAPAHAYHSILMNGVPPVYGKDGIFLIWQVTRPSVMVYEAESVEMILNHSTEIKKTWFYDHFHEWIGHGLLTSSGSKWKQRRKLLTPAFHFNILKDFLPVMNKQANILVKVLQSYTSSKSVDVVPLVTKCSFDIICETILGEEMHSQTLKDCEYLNSIVILTDVVADRTLKPWLWPGLIFALSSEGRKMRQHIRKVRQFANELISRKKAEKIETRSREEEEKKSDKEEVYNSLKRRALLDLLLDEHLENGSITEQDIREEVDTFTFEGHDTTSMAMSWSLYLIGLYPNVQTKIQAELDAIFGDDYRDPTVDDLREMKYLECVFKETLRLYPSVPGYGRQLQEDIKFKGYLIPKDCACFVWTYLLHRDPAVFPNPEIFDPDRFKPENAIDRHPFSYVPFSAGLRNCIGQKFAMMELKCVVSSVLRKYTVRSSKPRDQMHDVFEVVLRPHGGVQLEIIERKR